jgi:hypothetical protein
VTHNLQVTEPKELKVNKASGRGLLFVSAFYVFIADYINDCYNLTILPENLMIGNTYCDFTGVNLFRRDDFCKV